MYIPVTHEVSDKPLGGSLIFNEFDFKQIVLMWRELSMFDLIFQNYGGLEVCGHINMHVTQYSIWFHSSFYFECT